MYDETKVELELYSAVRVAVYDGKMMYGTVGRLCMVYESCMVQ